MKVNLTSQQADLNEEFQLGAKINENNPAHLRKVIEKLIQKSKSVIQALQATVSKLQKIQREKDYWKNSYLRFREACQKYIDADGIQHFKKLVQLEQELKKMQVQKQCLLEQSRFRVRHSFSANSYHQQELNKREQNNQSTAPRKNISFIYSREQSKQKQRQKYKNCMTQKETTNASFSGSPEKSKHKINPKKKLIRIQAKKQKQDKMDLN